MSNLSDFLGGSKPKLITRLTSGTGTYIPTSDMARCFVRIQAGGGGGWSGGSSGGGGGAMLESWVRIPIAGYSYTVGAGGAIGSGGSNSSLGKITAMGGKGSPGASYPGMGGFTMTLAGAVDVDSTQVIGGSNYSGVAGGAGGYTNAGHLVGFCLPMNEPTLYTSPMSNYDSYYGNGQGAGSGGDSFFGKGGVGGSSPGASDYGAGGGYSAAGAGGCIEIWDYGA